MEVKCLNKGTIASTRWQSQSVHRETSLMCWFQKDLVGILNDYESRLKTILLICSEMQSTWSFDPSVIMQYVFLGQGFGLHDFLA